MKQKIVGTVYLFSLFWEQGFREPFRQFMQAWDTKTDAPSHPCAPPFRPIRKWGRSRKSTNQETGFSRVYMFSRTENFDGQSPKFSSFPQFRPASSFARATERPSQFKERSKTPRSLIAQWERQRFIPRFPNNSRGTNFSSWTISDWHRRNNVCNDHGVFKKLELLKITNKVVTNNYLFRIFQNLSLKMIYNDDFFLSLYQIGGDIQKKIRSASDSNSSRFSVTKEKNRQL